MSEHPVRPPAVCSPPPNRITKCTCRKTSSWVVDGPNALSSVNDRHIEDVCPPIDPRAPDPDCPPGLAESLMILTPTSPSPSASKATGTPEAVSSTVGGRIRQITYRLHRFISLFTETVEKFCRRRRGEFKPLTKGLHHIDCLVHGLVRQQNVSGKRCPGLVPPSIW